ncbi:hypothetical protein FBU31_001883, partial [Coemansia sp. 'formosensis']
KNDIQQKLEDLLALTPIDLWTSDLEEVEKLWDVMVADYEQRLVDDEENRRSQGGNKGKGKARARQPAAKKAVAAKRKSDTVKIENDDDDFSDKPAAKKVAKTEGNGSSSTAAKARAKPKKDGADVKPAVKPKSEVPPPPPPPAEPITLGSDLDDSDEDVAATIFKKAATKRLIGGKQSTLSDMFARKTNVPAAAGATLAAKKTPVDSGIASSASSPAIPTTKPKSVAAPAAKGRGVSKKLVINSSDEESDADEVSDADDASAPPPPSNARAATSRRAAVVKKPVYMDISDDSGEEDFVGEDDDDDDDDEFAV